MIVSLEDRIENYKIKEHRVIILFTELKQRGINIEKISS